MLNTHWIRAATGKKKKYCIYARRVTLVMSNSLSSYELWPAKLFCEGWGGGGRSLGKNTGMCCHTLLEHCISYCPSCKLPLSTWCCQSPSKPSSFTTFTLGTHWGRLKFSRAASGENSSGQPTSRSGDKTTIETQGAVCLRKGM